MPTVRLLLFLGLCGWPLAFLPVATAPAEALPLPELAGRWKVETATLGGQPDPFRTFDELVFTDRTVEYVSTQPKVVDRPSSS
jgi:hypothetical protein